MYEMITHVLVTLLEFWADTFGIQAHQSVFLTTLNQVFKFGSSNLQFYKNTDLYIYGRSNLFHDL